MDIKVLFSLNFHYFFQNNFDLFKKYVTFNSKNQFLSYEYSPEYSIK